MSSLITTPIRCSLMLLITALLVSGCSSSSDSSSVGSQSPADVSGTDGVGVTSDEGTNGVANEMEDPATSDSTSGAVDESTDGTDESATGSPASEETSTTRVDFDITVPVYVSNSLQVRLVWGDIDTTAIWNSDELWTISAELPANKTNQLVVTFSDDNGAITLGSFETSFRTGANESEFFQISADQFDTARWDSDSDGATNLSESIAGTNPLGGDPLTPLQVSLDLVADKTFRISWSTSAGATFYRVLENPDGTSGFTQISDDLAPAIEVFDHRVALYRRYNASYIVQACNANACVDSEEQRVTGSLEDAIGFLTASNTEYLDFFGAAVSLSADGKTLVVGAALEDSAAMGINSNEVDNSADSAGAVYVFVHSNGGWQQQAYLKADNSEADDQFGSDVSLSADGNTIAVGASGEDRSSGAVYMFVRSNGNWQQSGYLKASNVVSNSVFGTSVSLSGDGNTLAVGAPYESSGATGINGAQTFSLSAVRSGAVYVFARSGEDWQQQAYLKADVRESNLRFGSSISLSDDGNTLAASRTSGVYVFSRTAESWQQQQFLDPGVIGAHGTLGAPVSLSANGNTLVVSATGDTSVATGINGDPFDGFANAAGAVYVFAQSNGTWQQEAYIKGSNTDANDRFGSSSAVSTDGNTLAIGASREQSAASGINGDQSDNSMKISGAVYLFTRVSGNWQQSAYLKAMGEGVLNNPDVSLSAAGDTLAVGVGNDRDGSGGAVYFY